jgi:cytoskeletal protein RodZ
MNRLYRLPLRTRAKNLSSGVRRRRNSSKILVTSLLAVGALAVLVLIGLAAISTLKHLTAKPKAIVAATPSPAATVASATPALKAKEILLPLSDPNKATAEGSPSAPAAVSPKSSPLVLTSTVAPTPTPTVAPHEQKTEAQSSDSEKPLTKAARKNLEKKRSEAERKRARLEKMYQNHEISTEAYNKGKQEYKEEIQKYRGELKSDN